MLKGYPSQGKHSEMSGVSNSRNESQFATLQQINSERVALDAISLGAYRKSGPTAITTTSSSTTPRLLTATSHGAVAGDFVRFETGNNQYLEAHVTFVVDANNFVIANILPNLPAAAETFYVMSYVTPRFDSSGLITATITGGATEAKQDDIIVELVAIKNGIGQAEPKEIIYNDYSSTNVTSGAYVELIASTGAAYTKLKIFDSSGYAWYLAVGAAGSEVNYVLVPPGGFDNLELSIASGVRLSAKALSTTLSSGELIINALGAV